MKKTLLALAAICLLPVAAYAGVQNDVPSCYAANPKIGRAAPAPDTELFVLVDQTTLLDQNLQNSVRENVARLIKPGTAFVIASFSAFSQGHYMEIINAGALETGLPDKARDDVAASALKTFDACMAGQQQFAVKMAAGALNKALGGSSPALAKSDVLASIKDLSARVRTSPARDRVVFIVSDMLENSTVSSFYAENNVRKIDPAKEMAAAASAKMIGDFGGARVFVLGAGIVPEDNGVKGKGVYRDPKTIAALKDFWTGVFSKSNAQLVEFGTPALMSAVH